MKNNNAIYATMIRAGKTTYFIDVREARNGSKYLMISEQHMSGDEVKRTTLRVFAETVEAFHLAIDEATTVARS